MALSRLNAAGLLRRFRSDARGAPAIEYALVASLVAIAALVAMQRLGGTISNSFNSTHDTLESARTP